MRLWTPKKLCSVLVGQLDACVPRKKARWVRFHAEAYAKDEARKAAIETGQAFAEAEQVEEAFTTEMANEQLDDLEEDETEETEDVDVDTALATMSHVSSEEAEESSAVSAATIQDSEDLQDEDTEEPEEESNSSPVSVAMMIRDSADKKRAQVKAFFADMGEYSNDEVDSDEGDDDDDFSEESNDKERGLRGGGATLY